MKIYAVIEGKKVLRMSKNKQELIDYRNSFPLEKRKGMVIAKKEIKTASPNR